MTFALGDIPTAAVSGSKKYGGSCKQPEREFRVSGITVRAEGEYNSLECWNKVYLASSI